MPRDPLNRKSNRFRFKPRRSDRLDRGFSHAYMNPLSTMRGKPTFKSSGQVMPSFTSGGYGSSGYSFARHQQRIFERRSYGGVISIIVVVAVIAIALLVGRHIAITPNAISVATEADAQAAAQRETAFESYLPAYSLEAIGRLGAAGSAQDDASSEGSGDSEGSDSASQSSSSSRSGASDENPQLLTVVSASSPLPGSWSVERSAVTNSSTMASAAAQHLRTMVANMEEAGLSPVVVSAYRSAREESELLAQETTRLEQQGLSASDAQAQASSYVAPAGASEHETGLAVDIVASGIDLSDGLSADLASQVAATPEALWLAQHCAEYGFVLRYPADKVDQTGVAFEPWHLRYVGIQAAGEMAASGQCLEEYAAAQDASEAAASDAATTPPDEDDSGDAAQQAGTSSASPNDAADD